MALYNDSGNPLVKKEGSSSNASYTPGVYRFNELPDSYKEAIIKIQGIDKKGVVNQKQYIIDDAGNVAGENGGIIKQSEVTGSSNTRPQRPSNLPFDDPLRNPDQYERQGILSKTGSRPHTAYKWGRGFYEPPENKITEKPVYSPSEVDDPFALTEYEKQQRDINSYDPSVGGGVLGKGGESTGQSTGQKRNDPPLNIKKTAPKMEGENLPGVEVQAPEAGIIDQEESEGILSSLNSDLNYNKREKEDNIFDRYKKNLNNASLMSSAIEGIGISMNARALNNDLNQKGPKDTQEVAPRTVNLIGRDVSTPYKKEGDKIYSSTVNEARKMGRSDLLPDMINQRIGINNKANTAQNELDTTLLNQETSINNQNKLYSDRMNTSIRGMNVRNKMMFDRYRDANVNRERQGIFSGIKNLGAVNMNRTSNSFMADIQEKLYNDAFLSNLVQ